MRFSSPLSCAALMAFALIPVSLSAQWLDLPTPGIPRTADGKPDLNAPAPRPTDGKPDLSGLWQPEENGYFREPHSRRQRQGDLPARGGGHFQKARGRVFEGFTPHPLPTGRASSDLRYRWTRSLFVPDHAVPQHGRVAFRRWQLPAGLFG